MFMPCWINKPLDKFHVKLLCYEHHIVKYYILLRARGVDGNLPIHVVSQLGVSDSICNKLPIISAAGLGLGPKKAQVDKKACPKFFFLWPFPRGAGATANLFQLSQTFYMVSNCKLFCV